MNLTLEELEAKIKADLKKLKSQSRISTPGVQLANFRALVNALEEVYEVDMEQSAHLEELTTKYSQNASAIKDLTTDLANIDTKVTAVALHISNLAIEVSGLITRIKTLEDEGE